MTLHFKTVANLNEDIKRWCGYLPHFDVVAGLPRSGLLAATILGLHQNCLLTDVEGLCAGRVFNHGLRYKLNGGENRKLKVLLLDDSVCDGTQMKAARIEVARARIKHEITYGAVYVKDKNEQIVDVFAKHVPLPRVFEWNLWSHGILKNSCCDIDGVLCRDPSNEENDDGNKYRDFIANVKPRVRPTQKIGWLVTGRLEKYRQLTEAWLNEHNIKFGKLLMLNLPNAAERQRLKPYVKQKAEAYMDTGAALFIESSKWQAELIGARVGKPVFCTDSREVI